MQPVLSVPYSFISRTDGSAVTVSYSSSLHSLYRIGSHVCTACVVSMGWFPDGMVQEYNGRDVERSIKP